MASTVVGQRSVRNCVFCNVSEPTDGRFLNCLHVICVSCLQENVTPEGSIECCICKELTEQRFPALALSKQLFPSHSTTLTERVGNEYRFAGSTGRSVELLGAGGEIGTWCDFCQGANGVKRRATHACNECDGALLCGEHVEEHGKIRVFRRHEVKPLSTLSSAGEGGHSAKVSHCPLHAKQELSSACKTCCVPVCQQCLVRGHKQHDVVSLSDMAKDLQEGLLKEFGGRGESTAHASQSTGCLNTCLTFNVEHMIGLAEEEMSTINDEATDASQVISDTFDTVRKLIQKSEEDLLDNVDALRWQQQRSLEEKLQRLTTVKENRSIATDLGKYLCDSRCSNADIVRLAPLVQKKLELLKTGTKAENLSSDPRPTLQATAMPELIEDLEAKLRSAVAVFEDTGIDLQKMTISKPERVAQGEAFDVTLTIPCDQDSAMSSKVCEERMQVTLVSKMLKRHPAEVLSVGTSSSTDIVLRARVTAEKVGDHVLEVRLFKQQRLHCATIYVHPALYFDPHLHECDTLVASHTIVKWFPEDGRTCGRAYSSAPYTAGVHTWLVKVSGSDIYQGNLNLGVSSQREICNDRQYANYRNEVAYYSSGAINCAYGGRVQEGLQGLTFQDGDVLKFKLDHDVGSFELHVERNGEHRCISGMQITDMALYFFVDAYHTREGMQVEIL